MKKVVFTLTLILSLCNVFAQESKEIFKPSGKPFIKVFTNFHSTMVDGSSNKTFEIQRSYFGYAYKMSPEFSGKVTFDVGNPENGSKLERTAYLKTAYMQYKKDKWTLKFGLMGRSQFKLAEKQWGNRYLYKSFQDHYKFGSSADLGIYGAYKISDIISIDASIENGEGYKKLEADNFLKSTAGVTIKPFGELTLRGYFDNMGDNKGNGTAHQQTLSIYAGYTLGAINVGAEYIKQNGHDLTDGKDWGGISLYSSYQLEKIKFFGRYDMVNSKKDWNTKTDGNHIIAGLEFNPVKGIKIAPNYQAFIPSNGESTVNTAYLSCEIKF